MWRTSALLVLLGVAALAGPQQPQNLLVIDRVNIVDGRGGPVIRNGVIVIENGRIRDIGRRGNIRGGPGITIVDARNKWAIPGLIDAHVHFDQSGSIFARPDAIDMRSVRPYSEEIRWVRERIPSTLARYLASGITAVVDMGGPFWTFEVRALSENTLLAPRVAAAGPLIATVGVPQLEAQDRAVIEVTSPKEAWELVSRVAEHNPDLLKILFVSRPSDDLDMQSGLVEAIIVEGHRLGLRVAVHATELRAAKAALAAGADVLVHSVEDRRIDAEFIQMIKTRDVIYVPTLMVTEGYDEVLGGGKVTLNDIEQRLGDPEVIRSWSQVPPGTRSPELLSARAMAFVNLQLLYSSDVRIAAGSDAGNIGTLHGPALHREFELMAEAGMRAIDIITAATRDAAAVMGRTKEIGSLERGKRADLILLDADPVRDVRNARRIFRIMKDGEFVDLPPELQTPAR
jgi:imidazolonepropionase-like amidohydrolase